MVKTKPNQERCYKGSYLGLTQGTPESPLTTPWPGAPQAPLPERTTLQDRAILCPRCEASLQLQLTAQFPYQRQSLTSFSLWGQPLDKYEQILLLTFRQNMQVLNVSWLHAKLIEGGEGGRKISPGPPWNQMPCNSSCCLKVNFFKANISPEKMQQDCNTFNTSKQSSEVTAPISTYVVWKRTGTRNTEKVQMILLCCWEASIQAPQTPCKHPSRIGVAKRFFNMQIAHL